MKGGENERDKKEEGRERKRNPELVPADPSDAMGGEGRGGECLPFWGR